MILQSYTPLYYTDVATLSQASNPTIGSQYALVDIVNGANTTFIFGWLGHNSAWDTANSFAANPNRIAYLNPRNASWLGENVAAAYDYVKYLMLGCGQTIRSTTQGCPDVSCYGNVNSLYASMKARFLADTIRFPDAYGINNQTTVTACITNNITISSTNNAGGVWYTRYRFDRPNLGCATIVFNNPNATTSGSADAFYNILSTIAVSISNDPSMTVLAGNPSGYTPLPSLATYTSPYYNFSSASYSLNIGNYTCIVGSNNDIAYISPITTTTTVLTSTTATSSSIPSSTSTTTTSSSIPPSTSTTTVLTSTTTTGIPTTTTTTGIPTTTTTTSSSSILSTTTTETTSTITNTVIPSTTTTESTTSTTESTTSTTATTTSTTNSTTNTSTSTLTTLLTSLRNLITNTTSRPVTNTTEASPLKLTQSKLDILYASFALSIFSATVLCFGCCKIFFTPD